MIKRNPIMAARRNPTMVANPFGARHFARRPMRHVKRNPLHYLKNPQDIEVAEIKVVPLAIGAAGAIAVSQIFTFIPFLKDLSAGNPLIKGALPGLFTVGAAWAIHKYLGEKYAMVNQISSQMAAAGVVLAVAALTTTAIGQGITTIAGTIKKDKALAAATGVQTTVQASGMSGGGFTRNLSGGGFTKSLTGGQFQSFNTPFTPIEGTAMGGFVMSGAASNQPPIGLGARLSQTTLGGLDLKDYAD